MKNRIFSLMLVVSTWCLSAPDTTLLSSLLLLDQKGVQGQTVQQPANAVQQMRATFNLNASYTITHQKPTSYNVTIQLKNPTSTPTSSWSVKFTLAQGEKISSFSNGNFTTKGRNVTVANTNVNGIIAPNGTLSFNFVVMRKTSGAAKISNLKATGKGNAPTVTVPAAPLLNAISIASNSSNYTVSWNSSANATSYTLQQSTSPSFANPTTWAQGTITSRSFTNQSNGTYYYRVNASNTAGTSNWSETQSVVVNAGSVTVSAPVLQAISNPSGSASYTVSWSAASNAQGYILLQATTSTFSNATTIFNGTATTANVNGNPAATYYYRVYAYNGSSTSAGSNVVSTTVTNGTPTTSPIIDGYWESWSSESVSSIANMHVDVINIAFANFTSLGNHQYQIAGIDATPAMVTQMVTLAHSLGKKVKLSIGGATYPLQSQLVSTADAVGMAQAMATYVSANKLDGIDIDIEDNTPAALQVALFQNMRQLMPNAILTYAPETPTSSLAIYSEVIKQAYQYMSYFSIQAYNNYAGYSYQDDINTILSWGVPASKIVLGLMPGKDDTGVNTSVAQIITAAQYVKQKGLHGIMFWSLNRDFNNSTGLGANAATNAAWSVFHS